LQIVIDLFLFCRLSLNGRKSYLVMLQIMLTQIIEWSSMPDDD